MRRSKRIKPPIREFADRGVQWLLETPQNLKGLILVVNPEIANSLDYSQAQLMPARYIRHDLRKQESDFVVRIPFLHTEGEEASEVLVYIMVEHQSKPDRFMVFRLHKYMVGTWDKQWREWENKKTPESERYLLPIIPIIFYTGSETWTAPSSLAGLMILPPYLLRYVPSSEVLLLNLKATSSEELVTSGHPFGWILRVMQREFAPREELEAALMEAVGQFSGLAETEKEMWEKAIWFLYLLVYHRRRQKEGEELMEKIQEEVVRTRGKKEGRKMEQTLYEAVVEKGRKEGIVKTKQDDLLMLLSEKFGSLAEEVERRVRSISDTSILDGLLMRVIRAESLEGMEL